jgi:hypothetical protein
MQLVSDAGSQSFVALLAHASPYFLVILPVGAGILNKPMPLSSLQSSIYTVEPEKRAMLMHMSAAM